MKNKSALVVALFAFFFIAVDTSVFAGAEAKKEEKKEEKKPDRNRVNDWLRVGGELRLRVDYYGNTRLDKNAANKEALYQRYRARAWAQIDPIENLTFKLRLMTEPRFYCKPEWLHARESIFFDELYVEGRNLFGIPLKVRAGRQGLKFGDGWLVMEGTPRDGSRSTYFDAIRLTYDAKDLNTTFDLVYIYNQADNSAHIHPFNDDDFDNVEYDEQGVIVYVSNKSIKDTTIDGYFIYRNTDDNSTEGPNGWSSDIYTFGTRVARKFNANWSARGEIAGQFGHKDGFNVCAMGANSRLTYSFNDALSNKLHLDYEYRSGGRDDVKQAFDPLWGRYWQWSTGYHYAVIATGGENDGHTANATNFHRIGMGWDCKPISGITTNLFYHLLFADQNTIDSAALTGSGCFRGQLFTAQISHKVCEHVTHLVQGNFFFPGSFYHDSNNDVSSFVKYQIVISW